jgi:MFS family permease
MRHDLLLPRLAWLRHRRVLDSVPGGTFVDGSGNGGDDVVSERNSAASSSSSGQPATALFVLAALILAAAVANLNLAVANVALPSIGTSFDASQTMLNLVAVGYSLGLAASVLYLGAVGDRYGRKLMLLLGAVGSIPLSLLAAYAPSPTVLVAPRWAKMVVAFGERNTFLLGDMLVFLGFATMLALWRESSPYWQVGLGYALVGVGVGFAQTPAAHSLTGSVPPTRVGMASGTADLQRDLGVR